MIITRTPFRISLFGGGTDYPSWYLENGGAVIGMAIDKYCYISLRNLPPFFEHRHRIVYSKIENVVEIDEIQHPAVRAVLTEKPPEHGLEIHHDGDLPARSGLASSSAFTVGLLNALSCSKGLLQSKDQLAREAIRIEQEVIGENVGSQDQIWAAYGGFNSIDFHRDGNFSVSPVVISKERQKEMLGSFMLFFTGLSRFASTIAAKQIANFKNKVSQLHTFHQMVNESKSIFATPQGDLSDIGRMLHDAWQIKRELADGVSNQEIDEIYAAGLEAGALGGKILGAGGGGFILFYVEPEKQEAVRQRLKKLIEVTFDIDRAGSSLAVYQPLCHNEM
jgi:D-glycero-alpha-D-manno-heptose-7-phosphate kinase